MRKLLVVCCWLLAAPPLPADSVDAKVPPPSAGQADLSSLRDITGIEALPPPPPPPRWPYWLGAGIVLLAGLGVVGWKFARKGIRPAAPPPPDRWALQELDRIEALQLAERGKSERFHTLVADVVRTYLQLRFNLQAPRQTTVEFLAALQHESPLPESEQSRLRELLERCDLAKFAPVEASGDDCRAVLASARALVQETARLKTGN